MYDTGVEFAAMTTEEYREQSVGLTHERESDIAELENIYDGDYEFNFGCSDTGEQKEDESSGTQALSLVDNDHGIRRRTGRTTCWIDGYKYNGVSRLAYSCDHYRTGCKRKCAFDDILGRYTDIVPHTCDRSAMAVTSPDTIPNPTADVSELMKRELDRMTVTMTITRSEIWDILLSKYYGAIETGTATVGLSREYVLRRVIRVRAEEFGGTVYGQIEAPPWSQILNDNGTATETNFLLFYYSYFDKTSKKRERLLGWAHPVLLNMLKQRQTSVFVYGTFRCVPSKFKQCMVFTTYDRPTKRFYPAVFVLCTSEKYDMYFHATRLVLDASDYAMEPQYSYCDFEAGMARAIRDHIPETTVIGVFLFQASLQKKNEKVSNSKTGV